MLSWNVEPKPNGTQPGKCEEIVVFSIRRDTKCAECGKELLDGNLLRMDGDRPLCLDCADLGHLEFLPSGNTALTRRATKYSPLRAVVVRWSRTRNRYERKGILVSPNAIAQAETECLADDEIRARAREKAAVRRESWEIEYEASVVTRLKELFPGCPAPELTRIAAWTCQKYSGRVGRSAAAKDLDSEALRLAVIAHIRHQHTDYDQQLMKHGDRSRARAQVRGMIDEKLRQWEQGGRS